MKEIKYYTHAGRFHCDEITAYVILSLIYPDVTLIRLTDISTIPDDGVVGDIGRNYDPKLKHFDHHQGFLTRKDTYPYATAGLVWKHYGNAVISKYLEVDIVTKHGEQIWKYVDENFIKAIDANDSDNAYKVSAECSAGNVNVLTLPKIVTMFNDKEVNNHPSQQTNFLGAAHLIGKLLLNYIDKGANEVLAREKFDALSIIQGSICVLIENIPWYSIIHERPEINFVIEPSSHPGSKYSLTAVPKEFGSREVKCPLERPEWFKDFIHQGKWIAGSDSLQMLSKLAKYNDRKTNESPKNGQ